MKNRKGRFSISMTLMEYAWDGDDGGIIQKLMSQVFILKADYDYTIKRFEYYALSPLFRELKPFENVPMYNMIISKYDEDEVMITVAEVK